MIDLQDQTTHRSKLKPIKLDEVSILVTMFEGVQYYVASARSWNSGPCPSPNDALKRLDMYFRGLEIDEAAQDQASRAQMEWVAAGGHGKLDPLTTALARMLAVDAIHTAIHSRAWVRASAEIARLVRSRVIDLADLAALPNKKISIW